MRHHRTGRPLNVARAPGFPRFAPTLTPRERFLGYCQFEPETGCVIWTGGRVRGRGKHGWYGAFWYDGRSWRAHQWAAVHIHGLDISEPGVQVDHCCPHITRPNTLCVEHLQVVPASINRELQWIRAEVGIDPPPPECGGPEPGAIPFYDPPAWLAVDTPVICSNGSAPF